MKLARRFWSEAKAVEAEGGFAVHLDARPVKTPVGLAFVAPTLAMAEAAAAEWNAQGDKIDAMTMPVTRAVNVALDRVIPERDAVNEIVAAYGETDLLCYRAEWPAELAERQAAHWDAPLAWAASRHGARLILAQGVMHVAQPPEAVAALRAAVEALSPWRLTAAHELVALSGSLVLGLAVLEGEIAPDAAWTASRVDEDHQAEQWGADEEAAAHAERRRKDFLQAARFLTLL